MNQFTGEGIEDTALFYTFLDALHKLSVEKNREMVLRYFEVQLLEHMGYRPQLKQCVTCHVQLKPVINHFCPGAGGTHCPTCAKNDLFGYPISINGLKVFRLLQDGNYNTIRRIKMPKELSLELERLIRSYIRFLLEKDVKSVAWLETLKRCPF
jgi:DNA repair protein RecO (recombination protein O)